MLGSDHTYTYHCIGMDFVWGVQVLFASTARQVTPLDTML